MATVTDSATDEIEETERLNLWNRWTVPAFPVMIGMGILSVAIALGFWQIVDARDDGALALRQSACEVQVEFRTFFTDYLESQIGTPVEDIPGFDQLSPEAREFAIQLAPVIDAGRERDTAQLTEYMLTFPIPDCSDID